MSFCDGAERGVAMNMKYSLIILLVTVGVTLVCCSKRSVSSRWLFPDKHARALAQAAVSGDTNAIDKAIAKGADINYTGRDEITPLGWVLAKGNKVGFEYLLKKGADPNVRFGKRDTLLTMAIDKDDPFFLEIALKYGADPNQQVKTSIGKISLLYYTTTTLRADPDMVRALVKYGAKANPSEDVVSTCARGNSYENAYMLLQAGLSFPTNRKRYKLIERLENRGVHPDDPEYVWRDKVVTFLHERGIEVTPKEWKREDQPTIINIQTNLNVPR